MEEVKNVERLAEENSEISMSEKEAAEEMKALAKQTVKRAKAREILVMTEIDLARIRERLAKKSKKLVERKEKVKTLLNISNDIIKAEKNQANFNEKVSEIQIKIAEVQRKIAEIETEIAEIDVKLANKKLDEANERGNLAKKQLVYVKLVRSNAIAEKISKAEESYLNIQKELTKFETVVMQLNTNIVVKQNKLADLKRELSEKLNEREKIRLPQSNS